MTGTTNIDELLSLLNSSDILLTASDTILRYKTSIEDDVKVNGGTVIYSYNNIIIASEISEEFFAQLQANPNIDFIGDLPLKKYGNVSSNLLDQLDISKLFINTSGVTSTVVIPTPSGTDGVSGKSRTPAIQNIINGLPAPVPTLHGLPPVIINTSLTLNISTNTGFTFPLFADGSTPITFNFVRPANYVGQLSLQNSNTLVGNVTNAGIYNITITATNGYSVDTRILTLTVYENVKITNTNLQVYSKIGTQFNYAIETIGTPPISYSAVTLSSGLTLNNNIISGIFNSANTYNITIIASGQTSLDSKILKITSGSPPIITSSGQVSGPQYSGFTLANPLYTITSLNNTGDTTYNIIGILPTGLEFNGTTIYGTPIYSGPYSLEMKATNPFGTTLKDLNITITQIVI